MAPMMMNSSRIAATAPTTIQTVCLFHWIPAAPVRGREMTLPYASTVCTSRRLLSAMMSQIQAQPPHIQNVNSVRTKCSAWLGPVTITPAGVDAAGAEGGAGVDAAGAEGGAWCIVQSAPSQY